MKAVVRAGFLLLLLHCWRPAPVHAQAEIAAVIAAGVKKVIKAMDLRIQRLQNQTIWLQNAQKAVENTLSKLRLDEITDWVTRQRDLYAHYFDELARVKSLLTSYHQVQAIVATQTRLVQQYQRAYALFKADDHFTPKEILQMGKVYSGLLERSVQQLDALLLVIRSFATSMTDAQRLHTIQSVHTALSETYADLVAFNQQNILLRLQRASDQLDIEQVKKIYGLP